MAPKAPRGYHHHKRCDPPGLLDSPSGSREILQTLQETNWRVESMVSCKFPLNQTMRIINLLRMLRFTTVQPFKVLNERVAVRSSCAGNHQENWRGGL